MSQDERLKAAYGRLKQLRERQDLTLKPTPLLKSTFTDFDGEEKPFRHRYYQVQGILHLVTMNRFLLGDDTGLGKCVVGSTLVKTNQGLIPIQDLNPGVTEPDTAWPFEDSTLRVELGDEQCPIKHFYYGGEKPTVKIRTHHGYEVEGSRIHPVMVRRDGMDQWVRLCDLRKGDMVAVERGEMTAEKFEKRADLPLTGIKGNGPSKMSPSFARLLGYLAADSQRHPYPNGLVLPVKDPEVYADVKALAKETLSCEAYTSHEGIVLSEGKALQFLESLGVSKRPHEKEVPWPVLQGSLQSHKEFLRAYVSAKGTVSRAGIDISSVSETLLRQIQVMLLDFGVVSRRFRYPLKSDHPTWYLTLSKNNARTFVQKIGLGLQVHQRDCAGLLESEELPDLGAVPEAHMEVGALVNEIYSRGDSEVTPFQVDLTSPTYPDLEVLLKTARDCGISTFNRAYQAVERLVSRRWVYDPVEEIEAGWQKVYDLEIDDPRHAFVSNGIVSHNTLMTISALCYVWAREEDRKVIVLTNKSVVGQWALEFEKFCAPEAINVITCVGTPPKREKIYKTFEEAEGPTVMIMGYATARRDIKYLQHWKDYVLVCDEATAFKNPTTQTYKVIRHLSRNASRFWALSATLIKNNLIEGYGIYSLLVPGLFPSSKNKFMMEYCITRLQPIPGGRRKIPVIVGYRKSQIEKFKTKIDPYFLARAKFDVAKELPVLQVREHKCGMTRAQEIKYREALAGLLEKDQTDEEIETTKLTSLIYCQQIVDHPELVDCEGDSDKMRELFELLTEGDLAGEKVIVFSRFRKMIDKLEEVAHSKKYKMSTVRITGAETDENVRKEAMQKFQDPKSDVQVCWITMAAAEGINLQAAKAIVFYDSPWSAGDYLQLLGRMIRIGSTHDRCYAIHMVARKTIDTKVMGVLRTKMKLIESVMGKRIKGEDMTDLAVSEDNTIDDIFAALQADARKYS